MKKKPVVIAQVAEYPIDDAFREFLEAQRQRLKDKTYGDYEDVVGLLRGYLDDYGYEGLSDGESALYEKYSHEQGEEHRRFCQLFGPEKITGHLGMFLDWYMIRKVMAGADFKRTAGTVAKRLTKWLAQKDLISGEQAESAMETSSDATRDLPKAEKAATLFLEAADAVFVDPDELAEKDYIDFDHHTIVRLETGKIWLEVWETGGKKTIGPISAPPKATALLSPGWEIACALGRVRGKWRIIEVANVYPH